MKFAIYFFKTNRTVFTTVIEAKDFFDAVSQARTMRYTDEKLSFAEIVRINRTMTPDEINQRNTKGKEET